jgi:hypothetical protein
LPVHTTPEVRSCLCTVSWAIQFNRCWGEYLYLRVKKWWDTGEDYIMRSFITCTLHQVLLRWSYQGERDGCVI